MSISVIKTGGKQYVVSSGDSIKIEKLSAEAGQDVEFETLLVADESGKEVSFGTTVLKVLTTGTVVSQDRADKVHIVKFKNKVRYRRNIGHRQPFTTVKIK